MFGVILYLAVSMVAPYYSTFQAWFLFLLIIETFATINNSTSKRPKHADFAHLALLPRHDDEMWKTFFKNFYNGSAEVTQATHMNRRSITSGNSLY